MLNKLGCVTLFQLATGVYILYRLTGKPDQIMLKAIPWKTNLKFLDKIVKDVTDYFHIN